MFKNLKVLFGNFFKASIQGVPASDSFNSHEFATHRLVSQYSVLTNFTSHGFPMPPNICETLRFPVPCIIYTRSCHFTYNLCQTSDSYPGWHFITESVVKIHLNRDIEVRSGKIESFEAALKYFCQEDKILAVRVKFSYKRFKSAQKFFKHFLSAKWSKMFSDPCLKLSYQK